MTRVHEELAEGARFAGFTIVKKLSQGGMGAVYKATQLSTGRARALKLMLTDLADNAELRAKFVREARLGSSIESDHVVEVVDAGVDAETGIPWLAMELLIGEDLGALSQRVGRLEPAEVFALFDQLTHALGAAHAVGIVHRDLKPENVFLSASHSAVAETTVKVLDFGIAKIVAEAQSSNTGAMGSAYWMAPEQTERSAPITPSTDVWALGLLAYRLFTGRIFWLAASDANSSVTMFLRELVLEPLPSASDRAREQGVLPFLPPGFDAWFGRCVARDQEARFPDAKAAGAALRELRGRASVLPASALSRLPGVVVRGSSPSLPAEVEAGIGTARTLAGPVATARTLAGPEAEPEEPRIDLPVARFPRGVLAAVAGGAVVALGFVAFSWANRPSAPSLPPPTPRTRASADELRCPKTMARIPGGSFAMGASDGHPDEQPVHTVALNSFCLDVTEVQVGEYDACVTAKSCEPAATTAQWKDITPDDRTLYSAACNGGRPERSDHPANCVTWSQARAFCRWSNKRLPTEDEWEYAARGSESRRYPWGNEPPSAERLNGCGEECTKGTMLGDMGLVPLFDGNDGYETTAPTRSFPAGKTREGVFDMAGNVAEWTSGHHCPYPGNNCASDWRVARGGAWNTDARVGVQASRREKNAEDARTPDIGFRCAL